MAMKISAIDPVGPAWNHMVRVLFKPFELKKWLLLGFCAFLAQCGEGGGNQSFPSDRGFFTPPNTTSSGQWFEENMVAIVLIASAVFAFGIGIWLLMLWLNSRGKFMLIDGIVKNRGAVTEPWGEYRSEGNSLFLFRLCIGLIAIVVLATIVLLGLGIAYPDMKSGKFDTAATVSMIVGIPLVIGWVIAAICITFFLRVFVIPTMYLKRVRAKEGWRIAWAELGRGHVWSMILFGLMIMVLGIAAGSIAIFVTCLTCCLAAIPYLGSVILLPIIVFFETYVLAYLEQHGDDWRFFSSSYCKSCGYDLRGHGDSGACPECGATTESMDLHFRENPGEN